jgi:hypothetical protein
VDAFFTFDVNHAPRHWRVKNRTTRLTPFTAGTVTKHRL